VNLEGWRCVHTLRGHHGDVLDMAWSPNDRYLATCSVDNTIIVWSSDNLPGLSLFLCGILLGVSFGFMYEKKNCRDDGDDAR
jgi:protein HIRA/HIR1